MRSFQGPTPVAVSPAFRTRQATSMRAPDDADAGATTASTARSANGVVRATARGGATLLARVSGSTTAPAASARTNSRTVSSICAGSVTLVVPS